MTDSTATQHIPSTRSTGRSRPVAVVAALLFGLTACTGPMGEDGSGPSPDPVGTGTTAAPATPSPTGAESTDASDESTALQSEGVTSGHPLASAAGQEMLDDGGTAVDAAIATAFADSVIQPHASGIGGGGASLVVSDGQTQNYDYREVVNSSGVVPPDGVGVPGFVAGLQRMHEDHGTLPWADLLEPATELAEQGAPVSEYFAGVLDTQFSRAAIEGIDWFHRADGTTLDAGDRLVQSELAGSLRMIAQDPDTVYTGELSDRLVQVPGLDRETLEGYEVEVSEPAAGPVGDYTLLSAAPALPGAALIQQVQIAEAAGIADVDPGSAAFVDLQSRAWLEAEQTVHTEIGDPDFVDVPVEEIVDPRQNAQIAAGLTEGQPLAASGDRPAYAGDPNTTHISVVDDDGTAVSMTNTTTNYWGSGREIGGFFLNNQLSRFGVIGVGTSNVPEPGRRSVSWSSPSMVLDAQGRPVLVLGTPGGGQIPNTIATVVTEWALQDQDLDDSVAADRFWLDGGTLSLESPDRADALEQAGYDVQVIDPARRNQFGSVQALEIDWDTRQVYSTVDDRRAAGYSISREGNAEPETASAE